CVMWGASMGFRNTRCGPPVYAGSRNGHRRLIVPLLSSRREGGSHRKETVGYLGSTPVEPTVFFEERIRFWQQLHPRLSRLANRIGGEQAKLMAAIHARIPMFTQDEQREAQVRGAEADQRGGERIRDANLESAEDHKQLAATVQKAIENFQGEAANADAQAAAAKERAERIKRGEE